MCQGLPCIGITVRLRSSVRVGRDQIPPNSTGTVIQEHLATREGSVAVSLGRQQVVVRVPEHLIEVIKRE
jgi:hypothetical protein